MTSDFYDVGTVIASANRYGSHCFVYEVHALFVRHRWEKYCLFCNVNKDWSYITHFSACCYPSKISQKSANWY